jgi:hypothetical protein
MAYFKERLTEDDEKLRPLGTHGKAIGTSIMIGANAQLLYEALQSHQP